MDKLRRALFIYIADNQLTQKDVAIQLNVSEPTLSQWLSGKIRIPLKKHKDIQKLTGLDLSVESCPLENNCPVFNNEIDYLTAEIFRTVSKIKTRKKRLKILSYLSKFIDDDA